MKSLSLALLLFASAVARGITSQPVDLGNISTASVEDFFVQSRTQIHVPLRLLLDFRNDLPDAAAMVRMRAVKVQALSVVAADLVFAATEARWADELAFLKSHYKVEIVFEREGSDLKIYAKGENAYAARALTWIIEKLSTFEPSPLELVAAKVQMEYLLNQKYTQASSADLALAETRALIDPASPTIKDRRKLSNELERAQVHRLWRHFLRKTNKEILMVGAFSGEDGESVARALHQLSSHSLTPREMNFLTGGRGLTFPTSHVTKEQSSLRLSADYGLVRLYPGPDILNLEESASFLALTSALDANVQALPVVWDGRHYGLALLDQAQTATEVAQVFEDWNFAVDQVRNGELTDLELQQGIQDQLRKLSLVHENAFDILVLEYEQALTQRFNARANLHLARALQQTNPSDIRRVADRYLFKKGSQFHQLTLKPCESLLKGK